LSSHNTAAAKRGLIDTGDTAVGKVVRIIDGDTFELLLNDRDNERIRLHGIDCPERDQPFSSKARNYLASLIFSKTVRIVRKDVDRYGRTIAMVFVKNINVNEALLSAGFAWHFKRYDRNPQWAQLEKTAADQQLGLWADDSPTPPWEWRRKR